MNRKNNEMSVKDFLMGIRYMINHTSKVRNPIKVFLTIFATILEITTMWAFFNDALIPSIMAKGNMHDTMPIAMIIVYFIIQIFLVPISTFATAYVLEMYSFLSSTKKVQMKENEQPKHQPIKKATPKPVKKVASRKKNPDIVSFEHAKKMAYMKKIEEWGKEL